METTTDPPLPPHPQEPHMAPIMTRTFFPVGNGIFCLERLENRRVIVYDYGSTSRKKVERRVNELTSRNDIDIE